MNIEQMFNELDDKLENSPTGLPKRLTVKELMEIDPEFRATYEECKRRKLI